MTYPIKVNPKDTIESLVNKGKYDWKNGNITSDLFADKPTAGRVNLELLNYGLIDSEDALARMKREGYRPATIFELLAFGIKYPDIQRENPIIALGSVVRLDGNRHVACLVGLSSGRGLSLDWFDSCWSGQGRFLAVRKQGTQFSEPSASLEPSVPSVPEFIEVTAEVNGQKYGGKIKKV